jgi:hypothetical protein
MRALLFGAWRGQASARRRYPPGAAGVRPPVQVTRPRPEHLLAFVGWQR